MHDYKGPQVKASKSGLVRKGWNIILFSKNKGRADRTQDNPAMQRKEKRKKQKNNHNQTRSAI